MNYDSASYYGNNQHSERERTGRRTDDRNTPRRSRGTNTNPCRAANGRRSCHVTLLACRDASLLGIVNGSGPQCRTGPTGPLAEARLALQRGAAVALIRDNHASASPLVHRAAGPRPASADGDGTQESERQDGSTLHHKIDSCLEFLNHLAPPPQCIGMAALRTIAAGVLAAVASAVPFSAANVLFGELKGKPTSDAATRGARRERRARAKRSTLRARGCLRLGGALRLRGRPIPCVP